MLSAYHLINKMSSSVLDEKISFSCLYPNKNVFSMTPLVFGCTYYVQDLSPRSTKCVFVRYSRTQKEYRCYNPFTRKYFVSADVTFFESIQYFFPHIPVTLSLSVSLPAYASTDSSPVPLIDTSEPPISTPIQDFKYVYTHR